MPNMDPGVMVIMAEVLTLPILMAVLVVELTRYAFNGKPMALPSYAALGAVAACPVGYSIGFDAFASKTVLYVASALLLAAFYSARWVWLSSRVRKPGVTR
jgi:hypothetical protein